MKVEETLGIDKLMALRDVGQGASKDELRQVLTCVCLEVTPKGVIAVTTDSYVMVVRRICRYERSVKRFQVCVPADALTKAATEALKVPKGKSKVAPVRQMTITPDGVQLQTHSGTVTVNAVKDVQFPNWATLIPTDPTVVKPIKHVALNHSHLYRVGKALTCGHPSSSNELQVEFQGGALKPILIGKIDDPESFAMMMPIRDLYEHKTYVAEGPVVVWTKAAA